jgi:hypothetical protein
METGHHARTPAETINRPSTPSRRINMLCNKTGYEATREIFYPAGFINSAFFRRR